MDGDILTIGFAHHATPYKRGDLFFQDTERLRTISSKTGPFQIIYGGKAHPRDQGGAALNGVPSLSVLDGWWIEGYMKGVTGWSIGEDRPEPQERKSPLGEATSLYNTLEYVLKAYFV